MALPTLDATFASSVDLPRKQMLAKWLVEELGSGSIADYYDLPERYLWAKIAVAAGAPREEAAYISLPKNYAWSDIYNAVSGDIANSTVVVSGLGDSQNNGSYVYDGDVNGRPSYRLNGDANIIWESTEWVINISGDFARSTSNVAYPWLATGWFNDGLDPTNLVLAPQTPNHTDWSENVALGHIAAAYRGDTENPEALATYIDWPWRYKVASIIKPAEPVQTTWDLEVFVTSLTNDNRFQVALFGTGPNITVDWGDGTSNVYTTTGTKLKTYTALGKFTVKISGSFAANGRITIPRIGNGLYALSTSIIPVIPNLVSFESTFSGQNSLGGGFFGTKFGIPENLFINHPNVTSFQNCFLAVNTFGFFFPIPERLFANNPNVTTFQGCFSQSQNLTYIPSGLFFDNPNVTTFRDCFNGCSSLTTIPSGLFDNNVKVTTFQGCFRETAITSIPSGLFDNNVAVTSFQNCFATTPYLTAIPEGLFDNNVNVTTFSTCFSNINASGVPEEDPSALTTIPEGLFANNVNVTSFSACFNGCYSLTEVPSGLFANNLKVTTFSNCFQFVTLTTPSYSNLLINMASNAAARLNNVAFHGGNSKYNTAGATARATLAAKPWTFTDGGPA